jgi:hypothetical protein
MARGWGLTIEWAFFDYIRRKVMDRAANKGLLSGYMAWNTPQERKPNPATKNQTPTENRSSAPLAPTYKPKPGENSLTLNSNTRPSPNYGSFSKGTK